MKLIPKCDSLIAKLYEWHLDDSIRMATNSSIIPHDINNHFDFINNKYDGFVNILIGVQNDKKDIVGCYFLERDIKDHRANMHLTFCEEGRGSVLKSSCKLFFDYCFNELGLTAVLGYINAKNKDCMSFIEKIGAKRLCVIPDYFCTHEGFIDCNLVRITQDGRLI